MFDHIATAPPDPILGLTEAFRKEPRDEKMNLGVGVYQDEQGATGVLEAVKQAELRLTETESGKGYLPITGNPKYNDTIRELVFGPDQVGNPNWTSLQTPGGTGGLRVVADFLSAHSPESTVWLSRPTWANHGAIFTAARLATAEYTYLDSSQLRVDFGAMLSDLGQAAAGDVLLLHGCCHNPSGVDLADEEWRQIGQLVRDKGVVPLVDVAYQGFGDGVEDDVRGLRTLVGAGRPLWVVTSCSKNFGLYRERVGGVTAITPSPEAATAVASQLKVAVRRNYSNPPSHGAAVVAQIWNTPDLRQLWLNELATMRRRIHAMREQFAAAMRQQIDSDRFDFICRQRGMFSFLGLTPEQVDRLRTDFAIYMVRSGRINVAGLRGATVGRLAEAVARVL